MTKKTIIAIVFLFSVNVFSHEPIGAVSTATGGTGRGAAEPIDSVLLNPAIVATLPTKFFSFNYTKDQWGLTIADNGHEALFPAALAFVKSDSDTFKTQQLSLALSARIASGLAVGLMGSMLEYTKTTNPLLEDKYRQSTGDLGIAYAPNKYFGLGLVANKVFSSSTDLEDALEVQKTVGLGASYTYLNFARFRLDVESAPENKTDRLVYMSGIETYMNDWVIVRLGYQNNNVVSKNYITAGLGFAGPQFGLHYGYISNVVDKKEDKHSIDLGIPF